MVLSDSLTSSKGVSTPVEMCTPNRSRDAPIQPYEEYLHFRGYPFAQLLLQLLPVPAFGFEKRASA